MKWAVKIPIDGSVLLVAASVCWQLLLALVSVSPLLVGVDVVVLCVTCNNAFGNCVYALLSDSEQCVWQLHVRGGDTG